MEYITESAEATFELGKKIGASLKGGETLLLVGEMGAGKTILVQGVAVGLGITVRIVSPTFILMRKYKAKTKNLYHVDLYRLEGNVDRQVEELGIFDLWGRPNNIFLIEWAEKLRDLPKKFSKINIEEIEDCKRKITYES